MFRKKFFITIMLKGATALRHQRAQYEFTSPRVLTTRNVGIIPPAKSIANKTRKFIVFRPGSHRFDNPYAMSVVIEMLKAVPTDVIMKEFLNDVTKLLFDAR